MSENLPCARHDEQIKTLFKRVDNMETMKDLIYSLDKNMAVQTQLMESVVSHNVKQDIRMDEQHEINIKVNENLTKLTNQYTTLDDKVDIFGSKTEKLAKKVDENEIKHNIDLRDVEKQKYTDILKKYGVPFGIGIAIGTFLLEVIKIFK